MSPRDHVVVGVKSLLRRAGIKLMRDRDMRDPVRLLLRKCAERGVATILDIGANTGQFAQEVLDTGWRGTIVSFEPIRQTHAGLVANARGRANWIVPAPMALGSESGETEINVSENLVSSSLLAVSEASTGVIGETRTVRTETIAVRRLDEVAASEWTAPFAIKIDTQGFELEVLKGAGDVLSRCEIVLVEMSLAPLYAGGARLPELYGFIEDAGFRCIALTEGFSDYERDEVLQVDGVFVRNR